MHQLWVGWVASSDPPRANAAAQPLREAAQRRGSHGRKGDGSVTCQLHHTKIHAEVVLAIDSTRQSAWRSTSTGSSLSTPEQLCLFEQARPDDVV
mmetsp:Transcript_43567/g.100766  ORF Transcript_43567/g.100766 Transcript_43567/m.100766 type:complete len:95 (+) Transcript_43567:299-583(+)